MPDAVTPEPMNCIYSPPADIFPPPENFPEERVKIYIGSGHAAADPQQLERHHIRGVLNVAYDVDDQPVGYDYPYEPPPEELSEKPEIRHYRQQFAKVGLIDGYGNIANHMSIIAAVYMAEQLLTFPPRSRICPDIVIGYKRGNLLIHCWKGFSRSVTVSALYIWYKFGVQLGDPEIRSFLQLYNEIKAARGNSTAPVTTQPDAECVPDDTTGLTHVPPSCGLQQAALEITSKYRALFPGMELA